MAAIHMGQDVRCYFEVDGLAMGQIELMKTLQTR